jgi:hypothetical protein
VKLLHEVYSADIGPPKGLDPPQRLGGIRGIFGGVITPGHISAMVCARSNIEVRKRLLYKEIKSIEFEGRYLIVGIMNRRTGIPKERFVPLEPHTPCGRQAFSHGAVVDEEGLGGSHSVMFDLDPELETKHQSYQLVRDGRYLYLGVSRYYRMIDLKLQHQCRASVEGFPSPYPKA